jgi:hypothetical protein
MNLSGCWLLSLRGGVHSIQTSAAIQVRLKTNPERAA